MYWCASSICMDVEPDVITSRNGGGFACLMRSVLALECSTASEGSGVDGRALPRREAVREEAGRGKGRMSRR